MLTTRAILLAILAPAMIGLIGSLLAWRPWRRGAPPRGQWAGGLMIAAAYMVGILGLQDRPLYPPATAQDWIFWCAIPVAILALIDAVVRIPWPARWTLVLLASAGLTYLVVSPLVRNSWDRRDSELWIGGIAIAMTAAFVLIEFASTRAKGLPVPIVLAIGATGLAMFTAFSGSQTSGQRAGIFAAVLVPIGLVGAWSKQLTLSRGGVMAIVLLLGAVTSANYAWLDEVNATRFLIIVAAPLVGCMAALLPVKMWLRATVAAMVTAGVIAVPLVPTARTFFRELNGEESGQ